MKKLVLSASALADLDEIAAHIAQRDIETALRVVDDLQERMKILRTSPHIGRVGSPTRESSSSTGT